MQTLSFDANGETCRGRTDGVQRALGKLGSVSHTGVSLSPRVGRHLARSNLMRDILSRLQCAGKTNKLVQPHPDVAFEFTPHCIAGKRLAR